MKQLAIVTGANRGIGEAIAKALAAKDYEVMATNRAMLDLDDDGSIDRFAASLDSKRGVDVLVNNAGATFDGFDESVARKTLRTNFVGMMRLTDRLLPAFNAHARIVMVSSGMGELSVIPSKELRARIASPSLTRAELVALGEDFVASVASGKMNGWPRNAYSVSKVLMNAYVRVLARELAAAADARRIAVNAACPGWVRTRMGGRSAPRSVEDGAKTPVFLATLRGNDAPTGKFFRDEREIEF